MFQVHLDHESVEESRRLQTEPIDLDACLKAFTKEEELGEDELWYCSKCKQHRLAAKKLDIWKLPPILVSIALEISSLCNDKSESINLQFEGRLTKYLKNCWLYKKN